MMANRPRIAVTLVASALIVVNVSILGRVFLSDLNVNDFVSFYRGGTAARTGQLAKLLKEQDTSTSLPIVRPPVYSFILAPLSLLPFHIALWSWVSGQTLLYLGCSAWAVRRFGKRIAIFAALFPPALNGISHGQDCAVMLATLVGAYVLARKRMEFLSGLVLGIGMIKFHLLLAWPFALTAQRRWKLLAGFSVAALAVFLSSLVLVGWEGFRSYAALLMGAELDNATPHPTRHISLSGFLANLGIVNPTVKFLLSALVLALTILAVRRVDLDRLFQIAPLGSLVIAPHCLYYDPTLLLLPLWLTIASSAPRPVRWIAMAVASPLVFFFVGWRQPWRIVASAGLLVFFGLTVRQVMSSQKPDTLLSASRSNGRI